MIKKLANGVELCVPEGATVLNMEDAFTYAAVAISKKDGKKYVYICDKHVYMMSDEELQQIAKLISPVAKQDDYDWYEVVRKNCVSTAGIGWILHH